MNRPTLTALSRNQVFSGGLRSEVILDIGATLEKRLDTLGVPGAVSERINFPVFYQSESGFSLDGMPLGREGRAAAFSRTVTCRRLASRPNPIDPKSELSVELHDRRSRGAERAKVGVSGKEVTPVLLAEFARYTAGASVEVNRDGRGERRAGRKNQRGDRQGTV